MISDSLSFNPLSANPVKINSQPGAEHCRPSEFCPRTYDQPHRAIRRDGHGHTWEEFRGRSSILKPDTGIEIAVNQVQLDRLIALLSTRK